MKVNSSHVIGGFCQSGNVGNRSLLLAASRHKLKFVAKLAQRADPSITLARFTRIVERLVQKRILQGGHTLRIVPKALHIYLWREWWNNQGQAEDLGALLDEIPGALKRWFSEMLIYANGVVRRDLLASCAATGTLLLASAIFMVDAIFTLPL